jgi:hypothetical protein
LYESEPQLIRKAADERTKTVRPRCLKHPEMGTEVLNEIAKARVCLTDPQKKAAYDERLRNGLTRKRPSVRETAGDSIASSKTPADASSTYALRPEDEAGLPKEARRAETAPEQRPGPAVPPGLSHGLRQCAECAAWFGARSLFKVRQRCPRCGAALAPLSDPSEPAEAPGAGAAEIAASQTPHVPSLASHGLRQCPQCSTLFSPRQGMRFRHNCPRCDAPLDEADEGPADARRRAVDAPDPEYTALICQSLRKTSYIQTGKIPERKLEKAKRTFARSVPEEEQTLALVDLTGAQKHGYGQGFLLTERACYYSTLSYGGSFEYRAMAGSFGGRSKGFWEITVRLTEGPVHKIPLTDEGTYRALRNLFRKMAEFNENVV